MGKYRKILVAFDGSESSKNALRQAIKLANTEKCWIKVLSVIPAYEGEMELWVRGVKDALRKPGEKMLSEAMEIAKSEGALIMTSLEEGEAYERIIDTADGENCDLIVMGSRGMRLIESTLVGSVTARVIGYTHRDVLVVPKDTTIGWRNILIATDGSKYSKATTERAIEFAKSYEGDLMVISVVDVTDEFMAQAPGLVEEMVKKAKGIVESVKKKAEASNIKSENFVREGETYKVIVELAKKENADVIFMGSHGRTGPKRLLMGSVTERVIGHSPCPVLVVRS